MNISLEQCKEYAYGKVVRSWGDAFVRGNNGMFVNALHLVLASWIVDLFC